MPRPRPHGRICSQDLRIRVALFALEELADRVADAVALTEKRVTEDLRDNGGDVQIRSDDTAP